MHIRAAAVVLLAACAAGDAEPDEAHIASAPRLVAEEVLRIGSVDDPEIGFSRIAGVTVHDDGRVYVLEGQDRQIRIYSQSGTRIGTFGRQGAGPGEFSNPRLIGFRNDTLAVGDGSLGRITFFDPAGELLGTLSMPPVWLEPIPSVMMMVEPVRYRRDGFATTVTRMAMPSETPRDSFFVPQVALDRSGRITDTLRLEPWSLYQPGIRVGSIDVRVPSGPSTAPLYADGPDDTYVIHRPVAASADRAAFTVTRIADAGDTIWQREIRYRPGSFTAASIDTIVAQAVRPYLRNPDAESAAVAGAIRRAMNLPPFPPPVTQARVGADGVLWLRLHDDGTDRHQWVLLDANGGILGAVELPRASVIHWSSGEYAWATARDELDVPWLVRYRLRPAAE